MALTHNSKTADSEPSWGSVKKTLLPDNAHAPPYPDRKYPHHWVQNGGDPDDDGRYTSGRLFLHKGGLNAAWAAANGARSGQQASSAVKAHLLAHRKAIAADRRPERRPELVEGLAKGKDDSAAEQTLADARQTSQRVTLEAGQIHALQPAEYPRPSTYEATLISAGYVQRADGEKSNWLIPAHVLQTAALEGRFEAIPHYVDHPDLFGFGWHQNPSVRDLAGIVFDTRWDDATQSVAGTVRLYDTEAGRLLGALYDQIIADAEAGEPVPPMGLSCVLYREYEADEDTGDYVYTRIHKVSSVDAVYEPGAAGYIRVALSAAVPPVDPGKQILAELQEAGHTADCIHDALTIIRNTIQEGGTMPEELTSTQEPEPQEDPGQGGATANDGAVAIQSPPVSPEQGPSGPSGQVTRIREDVQALQQAVASLTAVLAAQQEPHTIEGMGDPPRTQALYGGYTGLDRLSQAVDALLSGTRTPAGVRPLTGIRELYMLLSGDYELTGRFHEDRVYLANVTTSTMAGLVANRLNKVVINMFMEYDPWWAPAVTIRDFSSLQDVRWITLGGVGELPTVAEGAAYTEMTWDDFTETDSFVKKGGYLGITLETIDKDDTARVMAAPRALAQAAWLTLGKAIAEVHTVNSAYGQTMSDSNYLYDSSNHSNQGSTALSFSAWETTKIAMMKFTEVNSSERLGALTRPRLLWVPIDLENTAVEILAAGEGHPNDADYRVNAEAMADGLMDRVRRARSRVITVPFWTDTNDWVAQADPNMYPGLGLGFRYGRTPEIFSVADPRAGLMFTNDTMPIKVRFFFAVGPTDWRAWYKHIVS